MLAEVDTQNVLCAVAKLLLLNSRMVMNSMAFAMGSVALSSWKICPLEE